MYAQLVELDERLKPIRGGKQVSALFCRAVELGLLWRLRESGPAAIIDTIVSVFYTQERCQFERVALDKRMLEGLDAAYADMFAKAIDAKMSELSRVR